MHGMSMRPPGDGGGGGGSGRFPPKRPRRVTKPSGETIPASTEDKGAPIAHPMPVVLTVGTIIKLASIIVVPLLTIVSAGIYHYHKTNTHMDDPAIHLSRGERYKLETKAEAKKARKKLEKSITREVKLQARELKQDLAAEQKTQIKKLGKELKHEQRRLMTEVKKARKDIQDK